jgi:D-lactate dehydrogenase
MKTIMYSIQDFERSYLLQANREHHELTLLEEALDEGTAAYAHKHEAAVIFTGDDASAEVLQKLHNAGVKYLAIRAVGYDNIDLKKATALGIAVANVPEYSPYAIAEHSIALMLALNRKLILANSQVHHHNFKVGKLVGFDLNKKTVGIVGTGRIGSIMARILHGFGCRLLGYDTKEKKALSKYFDLQYVDLKTLCKESDIISLHTPLNTATKYLINKALIDEMKPAVMLINTARGAVRNTADVIDALETGKIGYLGTDVYEKEKGIFFYDYSKNPIKDKMLKKLMSFPNVIVTPHQAFATQEALTNIADTTFYNLNCWAKSQQTENELTSKESADGYVHSPWGKLVVKKIKQDVSE